MDSIKEFAEDWGIKFMRHEIISIKANEKMSQIMIMQAESERKKIAMILESEGVRQEIINEAVATK